MASRKFEIYTIASLTEKFQKLQKMNSTYVSKFQAKAFICCGVITKTGIGASLISLVCNTVKTDLLKMKLIQ